MYPEPHSKDLTCPHSSLPAPPHHWVILPNTVRMIFLILSPCFKCFNVFPVLLQTDHNLTLGSSPYLCPITWPLASATQPPKIFASSYHSTLSLCCPLCPECPNPPLPLGGPSSFQAQPMCHLSRDAFPELSQSRALSTLRESCVLSSHCLP